MRAFNNPAVRDAYASFPPAHQAYLTRLRELIYEAADSLDLAGGIEESLKWGQPSYLPVKPRIGSAVRTGAFDDNNCALYFNCQTMLVENIRATFGDQLVYSKNRAVLFELAKPLPEDVIRACATMALRYHLDKLR